MESAGINTVIINKPGAAHLIGYNYIANSEKPTIFVSTNTIVKPTLEKSQVIQELGRFSNYVYVASNSGIKSFEDLVLLSKTRQINFGHGGIGTYSHIAMEQVCKKMDCLPVPYKSGSDGMLGLLSGTIDAYALVSYGSEVFESNTSYRRILNVKPEGNDNWITLFGRNLPQDLINDISKVVSKMERIK